MKVEKRKIGEKEVMPFTIPSGIRTTEVSCLERIANEVPQIGILSTKSIGPEPRAGNREPIFVDGRGNAIGLTNPGAEEFARKLSGLNFPSDKFLLASIFGKDAGEFIYVAKTLEPYADGFELNLSCPHVKGHGMQLGQDPETVETLVRLVREVTGTRKPIFAKLTPNASNIGEIAKAAMRGGAYGITAINTVGPGLYLSHGHPVLTNIVGGLSGPAIKPIGLRCVRDISQAVGDIPIIAMGGISSARDIEEYASVGARFFGIGTSLRGMDENELKSYFEALIGDLENGTSNVYHWTRVPDMTYTKVTIKRKLDNADDFKVIETDQNMAYKTRPDGGQFVFAWIPGIGEKPFSIMRPNPLTLAVLEKGDFTKKLNSLKEGDSFYIRGPYGKGVQLFGISDITLVGGGCGIAGIYQFANHFSGNFHTGQKIKVLLGAKDKTHIPYLDRFFDFGKKEHVEVRVALENEDVEGCIRGTVIDLFKHERAIMPGTRFVNCGPRKMVDAVLPLELKLTGPENIYSSVDYMTRCGVGICGSCADEKGRLTCVEGPFMNP